MRTTLRMRRAAVVFTAVGALALAGCSDDGEGKDKAGDGPGRTQDSTSSVDLPKLDGEQISVAAVWTGPEQANFTKVLDEFEKRTGATVTFVPAQDPIVNFLGTKIAGGQPPDVAMIPQVGAIQQAVAKKWAKPVGNEARAQLGQNYAQVWQDLGAVDGTQYGVYFKAANKSLIWYNAQAFDNAGASEPKTWKDFLATAETVSASGVTPVSVGGADGWTLTDWFENIYLSQAGPEKYDQLAKHEIAWTDPSVKDALTTLAELFGKPELIAGGADGALQTEFPASVTQTFTGGDQPKAAMVFEGDFVSVNIAQTKAKIGTDAKVFPFPAVGADSPVVTGGDAAVALKDGKGAQALLTWLASTDAAKIWAEAGGFISPNKSLDVAAYPNDVQRTMAQALIDAGDDVRFDMSDQAPQSFGGTPGKGEWKTLQDFLKNPKDVAGTQAKLESDAAKAYKS
ncbi:MULTISPECIES: extracellular solute-binding protein [unclassified Streptomyces]|uniref:ABC transporter substrate-binding protein n=1 Tax=unclassified Streptomyces TaxID=2593676 RepID=UPI00030DF036|nr:MULTISPECIES: extracellular solute-binding protein [unclassified Streptomyces]MYR65020.1 extracellular solute-binding protein [Streptomyces sp. SID4939]MYS02324.1 extracellular solute-binding protein [Streptomyces sp. SID4940]MYT65493.1 extracellular solute-binding protein [Streptomyces sp. SID8357]MYT84548.1 extracellular solute-binding protein [Streptomyces sp. SID8360]MYW37814.1 extracellular solute-binding protein [Streptomyces sp. SID1]